MTIETKYNIGDEVWVGDKEAGSILNGRVVDVNIYCNYGHHVTVVFTVILEAMRINPIRVLEWQLFPTKEELLKSL